MGDYEYAEAVLTEVTGERGVICGPEAELAPIADKLLADGWQQIAPGVFAKEIDYNVHAAPSEMTMQRLGPDDLALD